MVKFAASLVACVIALGAGQHRVGKHVHSFTELPAGNVLTIHLQTSGCFNQECYHFNFHRTPQPTINFESALTDEKGPQALPTMVLSDTDLQGLDKLLDFYRHLGKGGCTTVDTVTINEYHDDQLVASETFVDRTCSVCDSKGLLSFYTLLDRASEAKEQTP